MNLRDSVQNNSINQATEVSSSCFKLSPKGLTEKQRKDALDKLHDYETNQKNHFLGYQVNCEMDYEKDLKEYLNYHINNVGDPFQCGNLTTNSKTIECAVLDYYAELWNATYPHEKYNKESYWGYSLSMGATEGNFYGMWNARDYLSGKFLLNNKSLDKRAVESNKDKALTFINNNLTFYQAQLPKRNPNEYTPVAFYSQDTHYSIVKAVRILNFETFNSIGSGNFVCPLKYPEDYPEGFSEKYLDKNNWPLEVPSNMDGSIHIPSLVKLAESFISKGYPIFVCFNYGTTFKGAYDNVQEAAKQLVPILKKHNMYKIKVYYDKEHPKKYDIRNGFWFHVDGALGSAYMPFIEKAIKQGKISMPEDYTFPVSDFRVPEIHSLVMSGHKWIGAPFPCGIYMTKTKYQLLPPDDPMYIGSPDTTFSGSRNGLAAIILWDYLAKNSYEANIRKAIRTEELAQYTVKSLKKLEDRIKEDLWVNRTPFSLTIRFKRPNPDIIFKYSLSCESLFVINETGYSEERNYAHMYTMTHVTEELIDQLVEDLSEPNAFPKFNTLKKEYKDII